MPWPKICPVIWIIGLVALVCVLVGLIFGLPLERDRRIGAVASNGVGCAEIGGQMLDIGGSAADAAIATMLCEGVVLPQSLGVGGGFVATIYSKDTGIVESLIAREVAPAAATRDMYLQLKEITGAIATAVPSEIYGYWRLHERYGNLPWHTLFEPTIELCRNGIFVSIYLERVLGDLEKRIRDEPSMAEIFINPETDATYKHGEYMYRHVLADTLELIANEGAEVIYRGGSVGKKLVEDIQALGGIITEQDLQNYDVRWEEPLSTTLENGYKLYTTPLPTSGPVLIFMLNMIKALYTSDRELYWHRLMETFKHAYGHRSSLGDIHFEPSVVKTFRNLIDPDYADKLRGLIKDNMTFTDTQYYGANFSNSADGGTAHISVVAPNGDAVSVTSTINSYFGGKVRSRQTGFILNDEMDDFSTPGKANLYGIPASESNYIKPGKRPMSSTCPSIVLDKSGNVKMIVGAAGGSKITTSVAQTTLRYLVLKESVKDAVTKGRLHHQLVPMQVDVEPDVPSLTSKYLQQIGHKLNYLGSHKSFSAVTAIGYLDTVPEPVCDSRRVGSAVIVEPYLD